MRGGRNKPEKNKQHSARVIMTTRAFDIEKDWIGKVELGIKYPPVFQVQLTTGSHCCPLSDSSILQPTGHFQTITEAKEFSVQWKESATLAVIKEWKRNARQEVQRFHEYVETHSAVTSYKSHEENYWIRYYLASDEADKIDKWIQEHVKNTVILDCEFIGNRKLSTIQLAVDKRVLLIDMHHAQVPSSITQMLQDKTILKVLYDPSMEIKFFKGRGTPIENLVNLQFQLQRTFFCGKVKLTLAVQTLLNWTDVDELTSEDHQHWSARPLKPKLIDHALSDVICMHVLWTQLLHFPPRSSLQSVPTGSYWTRVSDFMADLFSVLSLFSR